MKLDLIDKKILSQLDLDSRQSDSKIGKKIRVSKQVVNYRIKRLLEENIITAFYPHINIAPLGYNMHKFYLQLKNVPKTKEQEIWNFLINHKNVIWVIVCSGRFDLIFAFVSKNIDEFNKVVAEFMDKYSSYMLTREITVFNKATLHHRNWLINNKEIKYWLLGGNFKESKLDSIDKSILKILNKNARTPIIEIASELNESSSLIIYRIKELQQKGIIGGFRLGLNREKLGINYCKSFVYYQNKTTQKEDLLLNYCYNIPNVLGVSQSIGPWDLELEFEVYNYDDFHNIMKEMKNKFPLIKSFDTAYISREYGLSFLPKLI